MPASEAADAGSVSSPADTLQLLWVLVLAPVPPLAVPAPPPAPPLAVPALPPAPALPLELDPTMLPLLLLPVALPPQAAVQSLSRQVASALAAGSVVQIGFVWRQVMQLLSAAHAVDCEQHEVLRQASHAAMPVVSPQLAPPLELDEDPHSEAHSDVQAVLHTQSSKAFSSPVAVVPAVVWQAVWQAEVVQDWRQVSSVVHLGSPAQADACVLQAPVCALEAQVSQLAELELPAAVPEGVSARKLAMKPPAPDSEVTRMQTLSVFWAQVVALP